jgi:hypothetical protein
MPIQSQHEELVRTTPECAFAAIDNLPLKADWLPPCISPKKVSDGPNAVGDKLHYVYKQGGRVAEMGGEILSRVAGKRLHFKYQDSIFDVLQTNDMT